LLRFSGGIAVAAIVSALFHTPLDVGNDAGRWGKHGTRSLHRGVPYRGLHRDVTYPGTGLHDLHAGGGETPSYISRTHRDRIDILRHRAGRVYFTSDANRTRSFGPCVSQGASRGASDLLGGTGPGCHTGGQYKFMKALEYEHAVGSDSPVGCAVGLMEGTIQSWTG